MAGYACDLHRRGYAVTSRWLAGDHQIDDAGLSAEASRAERERFAREDWEDLIRADVCVSFTEPPRSSSSRGGRHVEFGAALALAKRCVVVGPRENVFYCLPEVEVYPTWTEALAAFPLDATALSRRAIAGVRGGAP